MPASKKHPNKTITHRLLKWLFRIIGSFLIILLVWMYFTANIVQLRFATLQINDLPSSFEGTTILYLSDLHINSLNSVEKVNALMDELMILNPDLLLLGGDYTNFDPIMRISSSILDAESAYDLETEMRDLFFLNLSKYNPPLGKYGIAGENDNLLERSTNSSLEEAMLLGSVILLRDQAVRIEKDGETLVLLGVDDWSTGMQDTRFPASHVSAQECVLLLCHNPEAIPSFNNQPASDGPWIDVALCGHTHGGGVSLFGYELFNPLGSEKRFSCGWHMENNAKVLISSGIGNSLLPLRLNTNPQAHFITLTQNGN